MSKFTVSCVVAAASMMICAAAQAAGGMPSKIPHPIDAYKITDANNPCIMCHGDQSKMGAAKVKGPSRWLCRPTTGSRAKRRLTPCTTTARCATRTNFLTHSA